MISKSRQKFEQSVFNEIHTIHLWNSSSTESLMAPEFQRINEVCSSYLGNRHTHTHTDRITTIITWSKLETIDL